MTVMAHQLFSVPDDMTEDEVIAAYVRHVIAAEGGNKVRAAKRLGVSRRSLYRRLESAKKAA